MKIRPIFASVNTNSVKENQNKNKYFRFGGMHYITMTALIFGIIRKTL